MVGLLRGALLLVLVQGALLGSPGNLLSRRDGFCSAFVQGPGAWGMLAPRRGAGLQRRADRAAVGVGGLSALRGRHSRRALAMCEESGDAVKDVFSAQSTVDDRAVVFAKRGVAGERDVFSAQSRQESQEELEGLEGGAIQQRPIMEASDSETISLTRLIDKVKAYCPTANVDLLARAYHFAERMHEGQFRRSGEPYFVHPVGVAMIIADMKLDVASVVTGLLHDTVEDTAASLEQIEHEFGSEIAQLVDGVTKIGRIEFMSKQEEQAENFRKMIIAMARDIRVILVKLADRTHNIRTLKYVPKHKQKKVARETLDLYSPLAHRLGIFWLKSELEDTSLRFLEPDIYEQLKKLVAKKKAERQQYTSEVVKIIRGACMAAGLDHVDVTGRAKHFYSIYQKMQSRGLGYDQVHDLIAFRILTDTLGECYQALGVVHSMWKPVPGRFKDYIALPKPNMYQSLHSTVIGPSGERIEVQIRTREMHQVAEEGIAAHWIYKQEGEGVRDAQRFTWLRQLVEWVQQLNDPQEFLHSVKEDLFEKEVYIFSTEGDLVALPKGSTVIDFAYKIDANLGSRCCGARVNGRLVTLGYQVMNGDMVDIITSSDSVPHHDWLNFARTPKAQAGIRSFLKSQQREKSVALGRQMIETEFLKYASKRQISSLRNIPDYEAKMLYVLQAFSLRDEEQLLASIGYGHITVSSVIQVFLGEIVPMGGTAANDRYKNIPEQAVGGSEEGGGKGVVVGGRRNLLISFCRRCNALFGEDIDGIIMRGKGITVHKSDCQQVLNADPARRVDVSWDTSSLLQPRSVPVDVECEDAPGMLAAMSKAISLAGVNIGGVVLKKLPEGSGLASFEVIVRTREQMDRVISQLKLVKGVLKVSRGSSQQRNLKRLLVKRGPGAGSSNGAEDSHPPGPDGR